MTSTGAGVLRPEQLARYASLERFPCSTALTGHVENHWVLKWDLPADVAHASTLPHPAWTVSVERGHTRPGVGADPVVITGVVTRRFDVTVRGHGRVLGVKFRPGGLAALTGVPACDSRDRTFSGFDGPLADLAARYGWYDQAHFAREFRALVGTSPRGYAARHP